MQGLGLDAGTVDALFTTGTSVAVAAAAGANTDGRVEPCGIALQHVTVAALILGVVVGRKAFAALLGAKGSAGPILVHVVTEGALVDALDTGVVAALLVVVLSFAKNFSGAAIYLA
jgi:hypothetical protein